MSLGAEGLNVQKSYMTASELNSIITDINNVLDDDYFPTLYEKKCQRHLQG